MEKSFILETYIQQQQDAGVSDFAGLKYSNLEDLREEYICNTLENYLEEQGQPNMARWEIAGMAHELYFIEGARNPDDLEVGTFNECCIPPKYIVPLKDCIAYLNRIIKLS